MAGGFDGSVNIDTKIDSRGFKAGMDGILVAAKAGVVAVNKTWEDMNWDSKADVIARTIARVGDEWNNWDIGKQNAALQDTINEVAKVASVTKELVPVIDKVAVTTDDLPIKTGKWGAAVNGVKRGFLQMASALVPGLYRINRFSLGIDRVTTSATGAGAALTKAFTGAAVTVVIIAVLIAALVGLFMGLYKQMLRMDGFKDNVKGLELAFANLKNAAMSALLPLFNAILPLVMKVVVWLTEAANAAGAFIAAISGASTYMVYVADSVGGAADSAGQLAENIEAAGDAAKGALAGFDKLNVLQMADTSGGGGGGGGGGSGGTGHWEERPINPLTLQWWEDFKLDWVDFWEDPWVHVGSWLTQALIDVNEWFLQAEIDSKAWLDQAAIDTKAWIAQAVIDTKAWIAQAIIDTADWFLQAEEDSEVWLKGADKDTKTWLAQAIIDTAAWFLQAEIDTKAWIKQAGVDVKAWCDQALIDTKAWIKKAWEDGLAGVKLAWANVGTWFNDNVWTPIKDKAGEIWNGISDWFTTGAAATWVTETVAKLRTKLGEIVTGAKDALGGIWTGISDWIKGSAATIWVTNTITLLKTKLVAIVTGAKGTLGGIWAGISDWFAGSATWVTSTIATLRLKLAAIVTGAKSALGEIWTGLSGWFSGTAVGTWITTTIADLKTALGKIVTGAKDKLGDIWTGLFGSTSATLDVKVTFADSLKAALNSLIGNINTAINNLLAGVNSAISRLNGISLLGRTLFDIPHIYAPYGGWVPYLAKGAVIPPNAAFAAILGDQRSGTNIEAPENLIRQIIREEMGGQGSNQRITVDFGSSSLGALIRTLNPVIKQENDRRGNSLLSKGIA